MSTLVVRGRELSEQDLTVIRQIAREAGQTRKSISVQVCERFGWRQPNGQLWDMACRYLLQRLHDKGLVTLPAPQHSLHKRRAVPLTAAGDPQPLIAKSIAQLGPLRWEPVAGTELGLLWNELIQRYHYLGLGTLVGPQLRYLIGGVDGWLAAMSFSGAAWKLGPRDHWIGWTAAQRQARLRLVVNQTRFLILPWVQSKNLASHILAQAARRLVFDWERKYHYRPLLLETFVDARRYRGTCYRAANWLPLGHSQGRGKMDREHSSALPLKDIFVYPLHRQARALLCLQQS